MVICYGFVKISIVYFYRRIFVSHKRTAFDITTTVVNVVLFLWSVCFVLMVIFDCGSQVFANWGKPADQASYCSAICHTMEEGLAGSDLILDVVLLVLPIPSVSTHVFRIARITSSSGVDLDASHDDHKEDTGDVYYDAWAIVSNSLELICTGETDQHL